MLDQIIIACLSGALIVSYLYGLGVATRILRDRRDNGKSWKESFSRNLKGIKEWVTFAFAILLTLIILAGLTISVTLGN